MSEKKRCVESIERSKSDNMRLKWEMKENEDFLYFFDISAEKFVPLVKIKISETEDSVYKTVYINAPAFTSLILPISFKNDITAKENYFFFDVWESLNMVEARRRVESQIMFSLAFTADADVEERVNDFIDEILKNSSENDKRTD